MHERVKYRGIEGTSRNLNTFLKNYKTVDSTVLQASIRRLYNRRFDTCLTVGSTLVKSLIRRLNNRRIDACATVESTFAQLSNRRLCSRQLDARLQTLIYIPFRTWIYFIFSYFTSYLKALYCNFRCSDEFFQMIGKTILLKSLNCKITNCKSTQLTK